jgi:glycosyltransferase involved in cell wall biosynthesis
VRADLTHAVSNGLAVLPGMASKWAFGTPFILSEHGVYLRERYLSERRTRHSRAVKRVVLNFYRLLTTAGYQMADLIAPGNRYNRRWELRAGADPAVIRPVYNGVDPTSFPPAADLPPEMTVAWIGRVDPIKDLETLVRAFGIVHQKLPEARLRLFGPTPRGDEAYRSRVEELIAEHDLVGTATFEGRVATAVEAYHSGRVVALTSISEGFPYTVIEAMMAGRATVSTDVGGVGEAVGDAGLLVAPRDHEGVAEALLALLTDDAWCRQLGRQARRRAIELFTLDRFLKTYWDIYSGVRHGTVHDEWARGRAS